MKKGVLFFLCFVSVAVMAKDVSFPYFSALRYQETNLRAGPGERYPVLFVYKEPLYPVEVLDMYEHWFQVREKDGTTGWVRKTALTKSRFVLIQEETALMAKSNEDAKTLAYIQPNVIAKLLKCPKGKSFCQVQVNNMKGWVKKDNLWGIFPDEVIDG